MSKNDGGQAFPHGDMVHGGCTGMTLRDYFAARAMQGLILDAKAAAPDAPAPVQPPANGDVDLEKVELWVANNCYDPVIEKTLFAAIAALQHKGGPLALPEVTAEDVAAARKTYGTVADAGLEDCFACNGNPFPYCPTCENRGWMWKDGADDPIKAALESYRARLMAKAVPND